MRKETEHVLANDEKLFKALELRAKRKEMLHYVNFTFPVLQLHVRGCHVSLHHTAGSERGHLCHVEYLCYSHAIC